VSRRKLGAADRPLGQVASLNIGSGLSQSGSDLTVDIDSGRNLLTNSSFYIWQNGTSFTSSGSGNNDDSYTADQVILLSNGNDIVDVTQGSDLESIELDVETANTKFGILMPLENRDVLTLLGGSEVCSLSFDMKVTGTSITDVRAAVLAWDSTADTITSDVVNAWGVDDANPTFVANWTAENTPAANVPTTSWQRVEIENVALDTSNTTNLAVFIWMNSIDGANPILTDVLHIRRVQLEKGAFSTAFAPRSWGEEHRRCQRYFAARVTSRRRAPTGRPPPRT
jgi:hypothetical protein